MCFRAFFSSNCSLTLQLIAHLDVQNAEEHDWHSATPKSADDRARRGGVSGTDGRCASGGLKWHVAVCSLHLQSDYIIAACDMRVKFVSGFSGSHGFAVVTHQAAAMWTDERFFLQVVIGFASSNNHSNFFCQEVNL